MNTVHATTLAAALALALGGLLAATGVNADPDLNQSITLRPPQPGNPSTGVTPSTSQQQASTAPASSTHTQAPASSTAASANGSKELGTVLPAATTGSKNTEAPAAESSVLPRPARVANGISRDPAQQRSGDKYQNDLLKQMLNVPGAATKASPPPSG